MAYYKLPKNDSIDPNLYKNKNLTAVTEVAAATVEPTATAINSKKKRAKKGKPHYPLEEL